METKLLKDVLDDVIKVKEMSEKLGKAKNDIGRDFGRSGNDGYIIINDCIIPSSARDAEWKYRALSDKFYDLKESLGEWKDDVLSLARSLSKEDIALAIEEKGDLKVSKGDDIASIVKDEYTRE